MREARVTDRTHHPIPGAIPPPRVTLTRFGERANQQRRPRRFGSWMRIGAATAPRHAIVALIAIREHTAARPQPLQDIDGNTARYLLEQTAQQLSA